MNSTPRLASVKPQHSLFWSLRETLGVICGVCCPTPSLAANPWVLLAEIMESDCFQPRPRLHSGPAGVAVHYIFMPYIHTHTHILPREPLYAHPAWSLLLPCPLQSAPHAGPALLRQAMLVHAGVRLKGVLWGLAVHRVQGYRLCPAQGTMKTSF